jgi:CHAD domain-containing protein
MTTEPLELEAEIPPQAAAGLFRTPPLAARRAGRTRATAYTLGWLDTEQGALAEQGLALVAPRRGPRLLLETMPGADAPWCPGTPPARRLAVPLDAAPEQAGEAPLLPLAHFTGRRAALALTGGVEAVLMHGVLRAGPPPGALRSEAAEAPIARLRLRGPPAGVLATMRDLAAAMPALPPCAAVAEVARAMALGTTPRPRRLGAPRLDPTLGVEEALCRVIGHLAEVLAWYAPVAAAGKDPTGVHQMRVALRRLRSALRAFRGAADGPELRDFDGRLKALASLLGPARDWDVFLAGLGAELAEAMPGDPRIDALLHEARRRRAAAYADLVEGLHGPGFRSLLWDAVALQSLRPWRAGAEAEAEAARAAPIEAFAAALLDRRWRKLTGIGETIDHLPDAEFHALRLDGKRMRYLAELFAPLWGRKRSRRFLARLAEMQEQFGLANDATVARALVAPLADAAGSWATGVAEGWVLARSRRARGRAAKAWEALIEAEGFWNQC